MGTTKVFQDRPSDILVSLEEQTAPLISGYGSSRSVGAFASVTQFVPQDGRRPRLLSPKECSRLQGFPEDFHLGSEDQHMAWFKRIGNAVSVPIATAVAAAFLAALHGVSSPPDTAGKDLPGTLEALA